MAYQFDFQAVLEHWPLLLQGVLVTLQITAVSTVLGIILGSICAGLRTSHVRWARAVVTVYVEIIRNTPLLIQAYFLIFGLASMGVRMPFILGATIALTVNVGAYTTEIVRAGIQSIKRGQIEAAECLGLSRFQTYLHVIIRPALERVYPALTSQYVLLMLFSSIVSAVGVDELFGMANRIQSATFRNFEIFVVIGVIYVLLAALVRLFFWGLGQLMFPRRSKLGTPL
ncbi:amino acid ABC transporter permease [Aureimonas fodinaquatilis]|uniref:Amino acid ABC transporter permease n=1 Tax=Aureimonas fodinaquatilis TaxID=2565783 RepID=A0A5B0DUJ2_9HYPH|nr:amino acid ABC transporter permease [Aureimonas fodinaquatilis]KAA0969451.1 amino acid ABC transporter permease [Aureimonas fodinaquatilis]